MFWNIPSVITGDIASLHLRRKVEILRMGEVPIDLHVVLDFDLLLFWRPVNVIKALHIQEHMN